MSNLHPKLIMIISTNTSHKPLDSKNLDKYFLSYLFHTIYAETHAKKEKIGAQ